MSGIGAVPLPSGPIKINKARQFLNKPFLAGHGNATAGVGIDVRAEGDAALLQAIAGDKPFPIPALGKIEMASISAHLAGGVKLGDGGREVGFSGRAEASGRIGVYTTGSDAVKALDPEDAIVKNFRIADEAGTCLVLMKWGYDITGSGKGSVALGGAGTVRFGVEGQRDADYSVIRRFSMSSGAQSCLKGALDSWMLPSQFSSLDDLQPGTWIVAETDAAIGVSLGAQFGYNLNWLRQTSIGTLTGDIGLKVQMGLNASLGFTASGLYAVVLSRPTAAPIVRLAVHKLNKKGWDFALTASASVKAKAWNELTDENKNIYDFLAAAFGVHGAQLVDDLKEVRSWVDPSTKIADRLSGFILSFAQERLAAAGIDPKTKFNEAHAKITGFLDQWEKLPHAASTALWSIVDKATGDVDLADLRTWLNALATGGDLKGAILNELKEVDFFRSPRGKMLLGVAPKILGALEDAEQLKKIREAAATARDILDGKVLESLVKFVNKNLHLDKIRKLNFNQLEGWAKSRLAKFLGALDEGKFLEIREAIDKVFDKAEEIYKAAQKALNQTYNFEFAASYKRTRTGEALLDMEFDLGDAAADGALALLKQAIAGDMNTVLTTPHPRVKLNTASLTHGVERQTHVEVTLPFVSFKTTKVNEAFAKVEARDADGRVLLFSLAAKDEVTEVISKRSARDSQLALGIRLAAAQAGVRLHSESADYSYSLRQAVRNLPTSQARKQILGYAARYFEDTMTEQAIDNWIDDLDTFIDAKEHNGSGVFGNTLLALDVSLSASVVQAWFEAPAQNKAPEYMEMSRAIQRSLRDLLPAYALSDPSVYVKDINAINPLLVWSSMPVSTTIKVDSGGQLIQVDRDTDTYWSIESPAEVRAMVLAPETIQNLGLMLNRAAHAMRGSDDPKLIKRAKDFDNTRINRNAVLTGALSPSGLVVLASLCRFEREIINGARKAAVSLAGFHTADKPEEALKALEAFGSTITSTMNKEMAPLFGGSAFRALGSLVFAEAAVALRKSGSPMPTPKAMMTVIVTGKDQPFDPEALLAGSLPENVTPVAEGRLVSA